MKAPDMVRSFDLLYKMAATGGRADALFGTDEELLRQAVEKCVIEKSTPDYYLEFPLSGTPCTDLVVLYTRITDGFQFPPGRGFGYQRMIDWYSTLPSDRGYAMGFEVDTGSKKTDQAGIYFQPRRSIELIEPFLKTVGEEKRASSYLAVSKRLPSHMPSSYIGLFPGRPGSITRIGGYMTVETSKALAETPGLLEESFEAAGFQAWDNEMLSICRDLYSSAKETDFQFDILPDGSLGDTFGLDISLLHIKPKEAARWLEEGNEKTIMAKLKNYGLIDDRYKMLAQASFAKGIYAAKEDKATGLFKLFCRFAYVKVKFKKKKPQTVKFYLRLNAC
jgi:hypothetical protein